MNTPEAVRNPRTGTTYRFPRDARRYIALVERMHDAPPCENGHLDCAAWDGGPCADMVYAHHVYPTTEEAAARRQENADIEAGRV